jgi:hypothetical protein
MITITPEQAQRGAEQVEAVGTKAVQDHAQASEPATKTPPWAARMRPKCGSGWKVATNP